LNKLGSNESGNYTLQKRTSEEKRAATLIKRTVCEVIVETVRAFCWAFLKRGAVPRILAPGI
jgi:predicted ATPase